MKKRDLFAIKERDLKFNKNVKFILSEANLRNQTMLYGGVDIYLRHILIILSGNRLILKSVLKLEKVPFFSMTTHFKLSSHIFIKNRLQYSKVQ